MFDLTFKGPERGDCTAPYWVELDKDYTVEEFIQTVLTIKYEWGYIKIHQRPPVSFFDYPECEYRHGKLLTNLPQEYLYKPVKFAEAAGGWSRMDYVLYL